MLKWLLRKRPELASAPEAPPAPAPAAASSATGGAALLPPDRAAWQQRLDAARGDDAALLEIARATPLLDVKLAAVDALADEGALKQAERAFRSHDRRVHQRVRQRLGDAVARRTARARAQAAIAAAQALLETDPIAANRLAALDREWAALGAERLEDAEREAFATARARLDAALQAQDEARRAALDAARAREAQAAAAAAELAAAAAASAAEAEAARAAVRVDPEPPPAPAVAKPARRPALPLAELEAGVDAARSALEAGDTHELDRALQAVDALQAQHPGAAWPGPVRAAIQALHAERQRLKGWQRWGGALAREGLVDEAEALARATADAQAVPPVGKLDLKAHGEAIRQLRARWKELDRSGAAAGQALWLRFDAALTLAHEPVAAQHAALKAARAENLAAREALLATLEAAAACAATPRDALQALQAFQIAWRKLGPVEHTVPAASVAGLQARAAAAAGSIEAPLAEARATAQREREVLVERAEALAANDDRDAMARLRTLQSDWQQHARALPLPRAVEAALWARFRQACDAVAARRVQAQQARDAEAAAGLAARETLLGRLDELVHDAASAADELARAIAQVEREWRDLYTPLPRAAADDLEARFGRARHAAGQALAQRRDALWQAKCDALLDRLSLCEQREAGADDGDALAQRWQAAASLPAAWQRALDARWAGRPAGTGDDAEALLLALEDALGMAAAAGQEEARRAWKLRALKDALEGRATAPAANTAQRNADRVASLLARADLAPAQRERLRRAIDALRTAPQAVALR